MICWMMWVDVAIFPFIRQFSMVNPQEFDNLPFAATKKWLKQQMESELFNSVMDKYPIWIEWDYLRIHFKYLFLI